MKKILIIALLALLTVNMNCGGSGTSSDSSARTALTLNFGEVRDASSLSTSERGMVSTSSIPPHVVSIRITISAPDMPMIVEVIPTAGLTAVSVTIEVPNGPNRHIICEALNDTGGVLYRGETYVVLDGTPMSVPIVMAADPIPPTFAGISDITSITQTSMVLSWSPATDNVTPQHKIQYLIYMATSSGGQNFSMPSFTTSLGETSYLVTGLNPDTTYYYVVLAMDEIGNMSTTIVEASGTTLAPPDTDPPTFEGLESATAISTTEIGLQWSDATDNVTPSSNIVYLIYMAMSSGGQNFATPTATTAPGVTTHTVAGLSPNTMYYFVVRARDEAGNTDTNTVEKSATTLPEGDTTPPTFAGLVSATALSQSTVELSWDPATDDVTPSSEIIYYIYMALTSGGQNFSIPTYGSAAGDTTYTVTGLSPGVTYYFVVRARDGDNNIDSNTVERSAMTYYIDLQPINNGMDTSTIYCDVRNNGTIDAVNVDVWFDYNDDCVFTNCDDTTVSVPGMSTQMASVAFSFSPVYYRIIVDPYNLIQESDESNNCVSNHSTMCSSPLPSSCGGM